MELLTVRRCLTVAARTGIFHNRLLEDGKVSSEEISIAVGEAQIGS